MAKSQTIKIRVDPALKKVWDAVMEGERRSSQDSGEALVRLFVEVADDLLRSAIVGNVKVKDDVAKLVLQRLHAKATELPETWPAPHLTEIQGGRVTRLPGPTR